MSAAWAAGLIFLAGQASGAQSSAEAVLAENDRAIAENKRMIAEIQRYERADPDKLERLRVACQKKLGRAIDRDATIRVLACVRAAW